MIFLIAQRSSLGCATVPQGPEAGGADPGPSEGHIERKTSPELPPPVPAPGGPDLDLSRAKLGFCFLSRKCPKLDRRKQMRGFIPTGMRRGLFFICLGNLGPSVKKPMKTLN